MSPLSVWFQEAELRPPRLLPIPELLPVVPGPQVSHTEASRAEGVPLKLSAELQLLLYLAQPEAAGSGWSGQEWRESWEKRRKGTRNKISIFILPLFSSHLK